MKRILIAAAAVTALAGAAFAQPYGQQGQGQYGGGQYGNGQYGNGQYGNGRGAQITLYSGPNFTGRQVTFNGSQRNLSDVGFNDIAMSARVRGPWKVCLDKDYRSRCEWLQGDVRNLAQMGLGRTISSVVLADNGGGQNPGPFPPGGGGYPPGGGGGYPPPGGGGGQLILYSQPNFRGERLVLDDAASNLAYTGFNDRAMSARVVGGPWTVCLDKDYRSRCIALRGDQPFLRPDWLMRSISSARPGY